MWKLSPAKKNSRASLDPERPVDRQPLYEDQRVLLQAVKQADPNVKQALVESAVKTERRLLMVPLWRM